MISRKRIALIVVSIVLFASILTVPTSSAATSLVTLLNSILSKLGAVQTMLAGWFSPTGTYHNVVKSISGNSTIHFTAENNPNIVIMESPKPFKVTVTAYAFGMQSPEAFIMRYHVGVGGDGFAALTQGDDFDVHTYEFVTNKFYIYGIVSDGFTAFYSYFIEYSD